MRADLDPDGRGTPPLPDGSPCAGDPGDLRRSARAGPRRFGVRVGRARAIGAPAIAAAVAAAAIVVAAVLLATAPDSGHPADAGRHVIAQPTTMPEQPPPQPTNATGRPAYVRPAPGAVVTHFDGQWGDFHYGVDIANAVGTPIVAAADGVVAEAGPVSGFGRVILVRLADGSANVYAHLDTIDVRAGQSVQAGDRLGAMGASGFAAGPRLYFEVRTATGKKIDPVRWFAERGITL